MLRPLLLLVAACTASATDLPCFRGRTHDGISAENGWRSEWPADGPPVAWKAEVGMGFSSIVAANGRAATVGHADGKDTVFCFDAVNGRELWKHSYPAE